MRKLIESKKPAAIDYVSVVDVEDLSEKQTLVSGESILIPLAVRFGSTRLIDNVIIVIQ